MPIRANRFYGGGGGYNDPGFSEAASNIGKLFAPPSGSDMYAAAHARSETQKAARLSELFNYAKDPNYNREMAERLGVAAGTFNPNQGYYSVDQGNATTRATNAADNARALQQTGLQETGANARNTADNTRALEQTNLQQTGENARNANTVRGSSIASLFGAMSPGQIRPEVPAEVASTIGLPALAQTQGAPKPMTSDELRARVLGGLPANEQRAEALHAVPVEQVQGANGLENVFRADSVGRAPAPPDVSSRATNYGTPDGRRGIAVPDRAGRMSDAQTGEPLPANAQIYSSQAAGTPDQLGGKTTEANDKNAYAYKMTEGPTAQILDAFDTGKLPTGGDNFLRGVAAAAPGVLTPALTTSMTPDGQRFFQSVKTALPMQLLTQSGQGVTEAEYERKMAELIPFAGEDPGVTAAKRAQFATYSAAVKGLAGGAVAKVEAYPPSPPGGAAPSPGQTTMPPLGAPVPPAQQGQQAAAAGASQPATPAPAARRRFNPATGRIE